MAMQDNVIAFIILYLASYMFTPQLATEGCTQKAEPVQSVYL